MARHRIYVYKDFLANIFNVLGAFMILAGIGSVFSKNLSTGCWFILLGLVLRRKAASRAAGVPLRIPAPYAGLAMPILPVLILVEHILHGTLSTLLTVTGITSMVMPVLLAVVFLGGFVRNKPLAAALILIVHQVIRFGPLLVSGVFRIMFETSLYGGLLWLFFALLPAVGALILFLRSCTMTEEERQFFI